MDMRYKAVWKLCLENDTKFSEEKLWEVFLREQKAFKIILDFLNIFAVFYQTYFLSIFFS